MTFLQPFLLWALPLALAPVLIHLLNRMRFRSVPWAAMMFLRSANRSSTRYAKLRQLLILLCRVLAVALLVLALSRPLAGGWLGWAVSPAPDVILIAFDRSASMEAKPTRSQISKRELALQTLAQTAKTFQGASRVVLLDSALRSPQEIASPDALPSLSLTAPTDTAADIPALLQAAVDWLQQDKAGRSEIWIASDLQRSNWRPDSPRWPALATAMAALPQNVRVRLLALNDESGPNAAISVTEATRHPRGSEADLDLALTIQGNNSAQATLPLTITVDGARASQEVKLDGRNVRLHHRVNLGPKTTGGWGAVSLPADANARDNVSYFVYGPPVMSRAAVVGAAGPSRRLLQLAAAPNPRELNQACDVIAPGAVGALNPANVALIAWQAPLPDKETALRLSAFVESGGVLIFFPPGQPDAQRFEGIGWGELQTADADKPWRVARWDEADGPLAKTQEGRSLPVAELGVMRRQPIIGNAIASATFADGSPFLARRIIGSGQIFFCATMPQPDWSSLDEGVVLVPLMQRLLQAGSARLAPVMTSVCGEAGPTAPTQRWTSIDAATPKDLRLQAGVYQSANRLLAVNRPPREDESDTLGAREAKLLFRNIPTQLFTENGRASANLQAELWRTLLFVMLTALVAEAALMLPDRATTKPINTERPT